MKRKKTKRIEGERRKEILDLYTTYQNRNPEV